MSEEVTEEEIRKYVETLDKMSSRQEIWRKHDMRFFRRSEMMSAWRKLALILFFIPLTASMFTLLLLLKYSENKTIHSLTVGLGMLWAFVAQYLIPQVLTLNKTIKREVEEG